MRIHDKKEVKMLVTFNNIGMIKEESDSGKS
jgi:hypothetical protein